MARATRSKPAPKAKQATPEPTVSTAKPLTASTSNPPKLFVLPKNTSKDARILTLDNPSNGAPSRYFFCPYKGFHEFTRIAAPKKECRSWLITGEKTEKDEPQTEEESRIGTGYITKSPDLFIATPIDTLFLILPAFAPKDTKQTETQLFLALDDYLDKLSTSSPHWRALLSQHPSLKTTIEKKMHTISDTVDAGDETMYRLNPSKLLTILLKKAERMVSHGLPPSLEEKYIKTALEVPIMSVKREDSTLTSTTVTETNTEVEVLADKDSQTPSELSITTSMESQVSVDTTITIPDTEEETMEKAALTTPPEIPHLLRLRISLTYLTSTYLPVTLLPTISTLLASNTTPSFTALDTHLSSIRKLKSEAQALRSISDNISRKRAFECDEEKIAEREEKKRKKEEEDKKKKSEGRGVKMLKKVNTSGMRKMSSFFTAAPKKT
jgi:hypothetical protein